MRPIEGTSSPVTAKKAIEPKKPASSTPPSAATKSPAQPAVDKTPVAPRGKASDLERKGHAPSNPTASKEVTKKQAGIALDLTKPSGFRPATRIRADHDTPDVAPTTGSKAEEADNHLVDDPLTEEQRSDLPTPKGFKPGSKTPEVPSFKGQSPSQKETQADGSVKKTYEVDGQTYTVVKGGPQGDVTTFEKDGVSYTQTTADDGSEELQLRTRTKDGWFEREVQTDKDGLVTDTFAASDRGYPGQPSSSVAAEHHKETGGTAGQTRTVKLGPDGTRSEQEVVTRPNGTSSVYSKSTLPTGASTEEYSYQQDEGHSVRRRTETDVDGSSTTRREKLTTSDKDIEELVKAPELPATKDQTSTTKWDGPSSFPESGRGETEILEVEVTTTDANGKTELQSREKTYAQTSDDVSLEGKLAGGKAKGQVTRSVTEATHRNKDGKLVDSVSGQQIVELEANGKNGPVKVTRGDHWDSSGASSNSFQAEGFTQEELQEVVKGWGNGEFVTVGKENIQLVPGGVAAGQPGGSKNAGIQVLQSNRDGANWLGAYDDAPIDFSFQKDYDPKGKLVTETNTFGELDPSKDGRSVTSTQTPEGTTWSYSEVSNDGKDYKRQTVIDGTQISTYEEKVTHGPGEFTVTSETKDGDKLTASSSTSRQQYTREELEKAVVDNRLNPKQAELLLSGPGPYYLDQTSSFTDKVEVDGKVLQNKSSSYSYRYSGGGGIEVAKNHEQSEDEKGRESSSTVTSSTDPDRNNPFRATIETVVPDGGSGSIKERAKLVLDKSGQLLQDGVLLGNFPPGKAFDSVLNAEGSTEALYTAILKGAAGAKGTSGKIANPNNTTKYLGFKPHAENLKSGLHSVTALGSVWGTQQLIEGIANEDPRQALTGAGFLTTHASASLAPKLKALEGVKGSRAFGLRLGLRSLGAVGGAITAGYGAYDLFTGDTTQKKVAGGLSAAAGAVLIGSAFIPGVGWVAGPAIAGAFTLGAALVNYEDPTEKADLDERLK